MGRRITIPYKPREWARKLHQSDKRWRILVLHRRCGKTVAAINQLIKDATKTPNSKFAYVAPTYKMSKRVAWDYLKYYSRPIPGIKINESELTITYPNGAKISLFGADNPDSLRGLALWGVVFDEYSQQPSNIFSEIIRPALADHQGYAIWIGCVKGDTKILTENGLNNINDYSDNTNDKELKDINLDVYGKDKKWNKANGFWNNGKVRTVRIKTNKGFELEASKIHPILDDKKKWVKMEDIQIGDKISIDYGMEKWGAGQIIDGHNIKKTRFANARKKEENIPREIDNDLAYLLGLWMAEGSIEKDIHRLTITCGDDVSKSVEKYGFFKVREDQWRLNSYQMEKVFDLIGMPMVKAPQKYIPNSIWSLTREQARHFLGGYFDGDGHTKKNQKELGFTSSSKKLLSDLQLLCTNFGAIGRLTKHITPKTKRVNKECVSYRLIFTGEDYERVVNFIKPRIERKINKINDLKTELKRYSSYKQDRGDYFIDEVVSIECGEANTYDFTIPDTHSFWTNGFISHNTPKGKNEFYRLYEIGRKDPEKWLALLLTVDDTDLIKKEELEDARKLMTEDEFNQEWYCSFEAAIKGAYYAKEIAQARADKRIGIIPYEPTVPVHTFWDLGISDYTSIGFFQIIGKEKRMIDYYQNNGHGLAHYVKVLKEKPYIYGSHNFPHDVEVKELGSGKSRKETLTSLGIDVTVVKNISVMDGINAGRLTFQSLWIDENKCAEFLDAIAQYTQQWDDKMGMFKDRPLHDWTSHAADMYRYFSVGCESLYNINQFTQIMDSNESNFIENPYE